MTSAAAHSSKSTIDRSTIASAYAFARAVAPGLAEEWAFRRFMTPKTRELGEADGALLGAARELRVRLEPSGERLAAWQWGEGPPVLLVHGWEGRAFQLAAFIPSLLEQGFSAVAFDAPAHGRSSGTRASLRSFALAAHGVAARIAPLEGVIGHSLGGLAVLLGLRNGIRAESAVVIAPPSPTRSFSAFARQLGLNHDEWVRIRRRVEAEVGLPFAGVEGSELSVGLRTPGLVIHDRSDRQAAWQQGAATAAAWPSATLLTTDTLGHRRILRDQSVIRAAVSFIARHRRVVVESADLRRWLDFHEQRIAAV